MSPKKYTLYIVLILGIISISLFLSVHFRNDKLKIIFLDVGQGDATLIQTPLGKNILIDTGPKNNIGTHLSEYVSDSRKVIDFLILTHPDFDHIGGTLSVLKEFEVQEFMHSGLLAGIPLYAAIAEEISDQEVMVYEGAAGQRVHIEPGVYIDIYSPHDNIESFDANEYSIVAHLHYYDTSILLMGDATKLNESDLVEVYSDQLKSDILKVGHHGSQTSTLNSFVEVVEPQYATISASCNNRFGHPHIGVLTTLLQNKVEILETCNEGDIIFESNGEEIIFNVK
ncbi:MAG: MBL fold metallo-hydrolase [Candidatus Pacebacteria bacterium]|nr:MBL fold metallo-hydrolase [Candidatus Paceibacterota bacterium]